MDNEPTSLFEVKSTDLPLGTHIFIPVLKHLPFTCGRDTIRERAKVLYELQRKLHQMQKWLDKEKRYLHDSCLGHVFDSDEHGFCKDCRIANPNGRSFTQA